MDQINPDLIDGSYAVIRDQKITLSIKKYNSYEYQFNEAVTVFEKQGLAAVRSYIYYDNSRSIREAEAEVYDAAGRLIQTIRKSDFLDASASGGSLYSDDRVLYINYIPTAYPFTVQFSYTLKSSNTAFLPTWQPIPFFGISLEQSEFNLRNQSGEPIARYPSNLEDFDIDVLENENEISYRSGTIPAIRHEVFRPGSKKLLPEVRFSLKHFNLFGSEAFVENWNDFGNWQREELLNGLDNVSEETIMELETILKGIDDKREKARLIYEYMQSKTRYVSIQVGIGGWKPTPAIMVDRLGYGDCKGLTNYTKALLKSQGIDSYYTIVDSGTEGTDINQDIVSMQGDHVMLSVPMDNEMLFLECTSQQLPFNFLGTHTDNRQVLAITPDGARILRTHSYSAEDNLVQVKAEVRFINEKDISGIFSRQSTGLGYERLMGLENKDLKSQLEFYRENFSHHHQLALSNITLEPDKEDVVYDERFNFVSDSYAQKAGQRILFKPNFFTRLDYLPKPSSNRRFPLVIRRGFTFDDTITIFFPDGYTLEGAFENKTIDSPFGNFSMELEKVASNQYVLHRKLVTKAGQFPKMAYNDFVTFMKSIDTFDNSKIVLIKYSDK